MLTIEMPTHQGSPLLNHPSWLLGEVWVISWHWTIVFGAKVLWLVKSSAATKSLAATKSSAGKCTGAAKSSDATTKSSSAPWAAKDTAPAAKLAIEISTLLLFDTNADDIKESDIPLPQSPDSCLPVWEKLFWLCAVLVAPVQMVVADCNIIACSGRPKQFRHWDVLLAIASSILVHTKGRSKAACKSAIMHQISKDNQSVRHSFSRAIETNKPMHSILARVEGDPQTRKAT